jgi:hypothetical protein
MVTPRTQRPAQASLHGTPGVREATLAPKERKDIAADHMPPTNPTYLPIPNARPC